MIAASTQGTAVKLRNDITINADLETVWRTFDDTDNLSKWQPTLRSFRVTAGTPGEPGQVAELIYDENGREVVVKETLTEKRPPSFAAGIYDSKWSKAVIVSHFEKVDDAETRWTMYANHRFKGLLGLTGFLARSSISERTDDWMQRFKLLVETRAAGESQ